MFDGIEEQRILAMTPQETRWLTNIKKAFYASDLAYVANRPEDCCLEELCKAIDAAKTLIRSLRGEDTSPISNKQRFREFLDSELPGAADGGLAVNLMDARTESVVRYEFSTLVYAIRCMVLHENENLNVAETPGYHVQIDWSNKLDLSFGRIDKDRITCNGHLIWRRLRQVLSKFISFVDAIHEVKRTGRFDCRIDPPYCSIWP